MTSCCSPSVCAQGTSRFFSKHAHRYVKRFRKKGLERVQRYLVEGITSHSVMGKRIMDIGCGVGSLHLTLLKQGCGRVQAIDLSQGMIECARSLAAELRYSERIRYTVGDFVQYADTFEPTDIAILDKVICCYEKVEELIERVCTLTDDTLALSYPRNTLPVKWLTYAEIFGSRLLRWSFRPYWHKWNTVHRSILANGFENFYSRSTPIWQVRVYRKIH
jgi:2-polyprenyl-3-methyl-5-hydroxy-6-metoxy-1,4-benzoquinol methylase